MVTMRLGRRLAAATIIVAAALLPSSIAHSADATSTPNTSTAAPTASPTITELTPSPTPSTSQAPVNLAPATAPAAPFTSAAPATTAAAADPAPSTPNRVVPVNAVSAPKANVAAPKPASAPATRAATTKTAAAAPPAPAAPVAPVAPAAPPAAAAGSATSRQDLASSVAAATNAQRVAAGLKPLAIRSCSVPANYALKLASENALYHNNLMNVLNGCGGGSTAGENIARGYSSVSGVTAGWMASAGHKANILNPNYKSIFVGVAQSSNGTYYWVENFTG